MQYYTAFLSCFAPRIHLQARNNAPDAKRPVYFINGYYPRLVDADRAPAYAPVDGQARLAPHVRPTLTSLVTWRCTLCHLICALHGTLPHAPKPRARDVCVQFGSTLA